MEDYCAMIFDLKKSRTMPNRASVQKLLLDAIRTYNRDYESRLIAPFLVILGDEWQGLLSSRHDSESTVEYFQQKLNVPFYVGIGIGECHIVERELTVNQLDGPAFYKARDALEFAKKQNYTSVLIS